MMRGKQAYDAERVKASAGTIAGHGTSEKLTALFPKGSLNHPTRANPAIWADWDRFSALARELAVYAGALASAAANQRLSGRVGTAGGGTDVGKMPRDPTPAQLATMAPELVFERLRRTCSEAVARRIYRLAGSLPSSRKACFAAQAPQPSHRAPAERVSGYLPSDSGWAPFVEATGEFLPVQAQQQTSRHVPPLANKGQSIPVVRCLHY